MINVYESRVTSFISIVFNGDNNDDDNDDNDDNDGDDDNDDDDNGDAPYNEVI